MNDTTPHTTASTPGGLEPHRGTLILVLGILSLVLCGFFTGIPAWIMGKGDLEKIQAGQMDPEGQGMTKAGMICGMICCILSAVAIGGVILLMILGGGLAALGMRPGFHFYPDQFFRSSDSLSEQTFAADVVMIVNFFRFIYHHDYNY